MPLVLATSEQWLESPQSLGSISPEATMGEMASKVQKLEEIMGEFMATNNLKMEAITEIIQSKPEAVSKKKEIVIEDETHEVFKETSYASKALAGSHISSKVPPSQLQTSDPLRKLLLNLTSQTPKKPQHKPRTKNVFHGKAQSDDEKASNNLAADVDLVAFGVSTKTEPDQLKAFLVGKGLEIENVECMTRPELVTEKKVCSKTMRVTVKASEHKKAMNPDMWPFRVGVRLYKAQSRRRETENQDWSNQTGGTHSEDAGGEKRGQGRQPYTSQIPIQNKYPPGSQEYGRNKRRNQYQSVGGWQVPRNAPATELSLMEALKSLLSSCP